MRGRKIIVWLAIADLLASLGVLTRSIIWFNYKSTIMPGLNDDGSILFCILTSVSSQLEIYVEEYLNSLLFRS